MPNKEQDARQKLTGAKTEKDEAAAKHALAEAIAEENTRLRRAQVDQIEAEARGLI